MKESSIKLLKRFSTYIMKYKKILFLDLICAILTTVCELVLPLIVRDITNVVTKDYKLLTMELIIKTVLIYVVLAVINCMAEFYMSNMGHVMGVKIETDIREDVYAHVLKLPNEFFNNTKVGQTMSKLTNDLYNVTEFAHHFPEDMVIVASKLIFSVTILSIFNYKLTLIVFAAIPLMSYVFVVLNKIIAKKYREQQEQIGELNSCIEEGLAGYKVVKTFANEDVEKKKFDKANNDFLHIISRQYFYLGLYNINSKVIEGVMFITVLLAGGIFLINSWINPGDYIAYIMYVSTLISTIKQIILFADQFQKGVAGLYRVKSLLDEEVKIKDSDNAIELKDVKGDIELQDVEFKYNDDGNDVFKKLNLKIKAGENLALVGPSGSGKTTLCNLIPRFYELESGSIYVDNKDIKDISLKSLRKNIGIVQQDVFLFSTTIYDNIVYGKPKASKEEVIEAAKMAGAHEFIMKLQDGYDTYIGEKGVKLSGGQKQRISIARVFLKNPPIIILDEATSSLDNESEYEVSKALSKLAKGRTTITVAHRLSTINGADRIIVLTNEGIVEEGTHEELIRSKGLYYNYYKKVEPVIQYA